MTANLSNVVIIGCGTAGANVAVELIKRRIVDRLTLIDYDIISGATSPFEKDEIGLHKATVTRGLCLIENPNATVNAVIGKATKDTNLNGYFVIDCRDDKTKDVRSDVRISIDGCYLTLDCRKDYVPYDEKRYRFFREPERIAQMMDIVERYFIKEQYNYNQCECYMCTKDGVSRYVQ